MALASWLVALRSGLQRNVGKCGANSGRPAAPPAQSFDQLTQAGARECFLLMPAAVCQEDRVVQFTRLLLQVIEECLTRNPAKVNCPFLVALAEYRAASAMQVQVTKFQRAQLTGAHSAVEEQMDNRKITSRMVGGCRGSLYFDEVLVGEWLDLVSICFWRANATHGRRFEHAFFHKPVKKTLYWV